MLPARDVGSKLAKKPSKERGMEHSLLAKFNLESMHQFCLHLWMATEINIL
jgi:hypothetical protein